MKFILGKKIAMTQVFLDNGNVVPVTRIAAGPCVVTQLKKDAAGTVSAVQLGFDEQKTFRLTRSERGHMQGLDWKPGLSARTLREFSFTDGTANALQRGDVITTATFAVGDKVEVMGTTKGKGFQGVVKRHGFAGGPASHGHKDNLRMPGSIGAGGVQRVFKDMRMGGHMGDTHVTVKNLSIVAIDAEHNELLVKGAVPGARNGLVVILAPEGTMTVASSLLTKAAAVPEVKQEETPAVEVAETVAEVQTETASEAVEEKVAV